MMSMILRSKAVVRLLWAKAQSARFYSENKGLVLGVYSDKEGKNWQLTPSGEKFDSDVNGALVNCLQLKGELKEGKSLTLWGNYKDFKSVVLVGLGSKDRGYNSLERICEDRESVRVAAGVGSKELQSQGLKTISVDSMGDAEAAAEGSHLATWKFQEYKSKKEPLPSIENFDSKDSSEWQSGKVLAEGQNISRLLEETPSNLMTPTIFAENVCNLLAANKNIKVEVHDKKWAEEKKMGAFLSVSRGSNEPPKFLEITYGPTSGNPQVLIGKGVTFDSGGISIKPSAKMDEMRADMGGAACVIGTLVALSKLNYAGHIKALVPLTENMPSGTATKPGDVVRAMNGKSICIDNTDAEGRLILADALCYGAQFKPRWMIDMATLTGAIGVALGKSACGVFANNDPLFGSLEEAGGRTGDRVWRMPLWNMFSKQVTAYTAYDVNNVGKAAGSGGSCTAAAFLKEFVPNEVPWMHLDIAGVTFPGDHIPYLSGITGRPTRTIVQFIRSFKDS